MPLPSFINSFADKAQSALNASPLAAHLPAGVTGHGTHSTQAGRPSSPDPASQPSANSAAAQGGHRSHAFDAIQHQIRSFGQQYTSSATPIQRIITTEKGVAIDFDGVCRDSKAQSKELYTWGQNESEDIRDVSDRLAYLNFVQGSLASSLAVQLDNARAPFKALRDAEATLLPRRNARSGLELQIGRMEADQQKGNERKIAELRDQLKRSHLDGESQEKEFELKKRKALRESEQIKWDALREFGEKVVLLSQAASSIIAALPSQPPSATTPYTGTQTTGAVRASLQRALDNYKTGHIELPSQHAGANLNRSDTASFGESHASELSSIASTESLQHYQPSLPMTPPPQSMHLPHDHLEHGYTPDIHQLPSATPGFRPQGSQHQGDQHQGSQYGSGSLVPGQPAVGSSAPGGYSPSANTSSLPATSTINTAALNMSPAPIPEGTAAANFSPPATENAPPAAPTPTVAETGIPLLSKGPGPASGSLHDIHAASPSAGPRSGGLSGNESHNSGYGQGFEHQQHGLDFQRDYAPAPSGAPPAGAPSTGVPSAGAPSTGAPSTGAAYVGSSPAGAPSTGAPIPGAPLAGVLSDSATHPQSSNAPATAGAQKYESAEDEKKRLQREDRERVLGGGNQTGAQLAGPAPGYETADDEKKRLEREERERILHGQGATGATGGPNVGAPKKEDDLPPYQDY